MKRKMMLLPVLALVLLGMGAWFIYSNYPRTIKPKSKLPEIVIPSQEPVFVLDGTTVHPALAAMPISASDSAVFNKPQIQGNTIFYQFLSTVRTIDRSKGTTITLTNKGAQLPRLTLPENPVVLTSKLNGGPADQQQASVDDLVVGRNVLVNALYDLTEKTWKTGAITIVIGPITRSATSNGAQ